VSLGIYFDPRELPPGLSPELDRYKIQIEEFDRRFSLAVGLGVGLTPVAVLGFLGLSGIVATQGVLQGIAAILATMIAFFEETFKD
ncbi:hypothetical protein, partial [Enterococcus sp. 6D12_DIV0197]